MLFPPFLYPREYISALPHHASQRHIKVSSANLSSHLRVVIKSLANEIKSLTDEKQVTCEGVKPLRDRRAAWEHVPFSKSLTYTLIPLDLSGEPYLGHPSPLFRHPNK